jgi:hypothetical protein
MTLSTRKSPIRDSVVLPLLVATAAMAGCATAPGPASDVGDAIRAEGRIVSIDTQPWAYDGHAVVVLEAEGSPITIQLPARWNLCAAAPVDVEALQVGQRARVVGARADQGEVVVCGDASHQLVPIR